MQNLSDNIAIRTEDQLSYVRTFYASSFKLTHDQVPASIPVNTDSVNCSPLYEIRESQNPNAAINTFGNTAFNTNHPNYGASQAQSSDGLRDTQYANPGPGPPFHISDINNVNLNSRNTQHNMTQLNAFTLSSTTDAEDLVLSGNYNFPNDSEMDLSGSIGQDHPSPATISSNSRGGSTSQSSYSPSAQNASSGGNDAPTHHLPYRASPKPAPRTVSSTGFASATAASTAFPSFNGTPSSTGAGSLPANPPHTAAANVSSSSGIDMFSTTFSTAGIPSDEAFNHGFLVGSEWDYATMGGMNAQGMTPMSEGSWNQMLENVTMGWDSGVPPHEGELK